MFKLRLCLSFLFFSTSANVCGDGSVMIDFGVKGRRHAAFSSGFFLFLLYESAHARHRGPRNFGQSMRFLTLRTKFFSPPCRRHLIFPAHIPLSVAISVFAEPGFARDEKRTKCGNGYHDNRRGGFNQLPEYHPYEVRAVNSVDSAKYYRYSQDSDDDHEN